MIKTLSKLGLVLSMLSLSFNAVAHSGVSGSSIMHTMLHIGTSAIVAIAVIVTAIVLRKRFPKAIKLRVKK